MRQHTAAVPKDANRCLTPTARRSACGEHFHAEQQLLLDQIHFMQRQPALPACPSGALLRARWCASVCPYGGCRMMQIILVAQVCKRLQ